MIHFRAGKVRSGPFAAVLARKEATVRRWIAMLFLAGSTAVAAGDLPATPTGTTEFTLDNGLRVVLQPRHEVPMIAATAIVGAGSALEDADFSGASHFLEHLLFNGTSTMDQDALYDAVDRIGGYNNAHTDEDHTYFTMLVPAEHAAVGLGIQAAMLFDSSLPADKFDKERGIILEELARDRSRPGHDAQVAVRDALWTGTPYARPVIGTYDSLAGIGLDRVRAYWETRYVPGNIVVWVLGDFEPATMRAAIERTYGSFARPGGPPVLPDPFAGADGATMIRIAVDDPSPRVAIAIPAPGPCEAGGAAAELLAGVLSSEDGPLRRALGPEVASSIRVDAIARPAGSALVVRADLVEEADPAAAAATLLAALETVARDGLATPGLDAAGLLRTARAARAQHLLMAQRIHYVGMMLADTVASCGGSVATVVDPDHAQVIEPADVARAARTILGPLRERARVVLAGPDLVPYGPGPIELPAVDPPPPPAAIASSSVPGADLDRTLPSGMRVLVGREPDADVTGIHVLVRDRAAREPDGLGGISDVLHRMLPNGTALSDRAQVASRLERIGADLKTADSDFIPYDDYYTDPSHGFVRLEVPSEGWLAALDLLAEILRAPALDDADLASLLPARVMRAEQQAASPAVVGSGAYTAALLGDGHPSARPVSGTPDSLGKIDGGAVREFATSYLAPDGLVLSVVGPHEPEDVLGAIAERFPTAPAGVTWAPAPAWPTTTATGDPVIVELGAEQSRLYLGRIADAAPTDRAALRVLGAVLSDRLARTVREELGIAYSVGADASLSASPDRGWLTIHVGTRPENLDTALAAVRDEIERLRADMAPQDEIDRIRAERRGRSLMRRMSAINRARSLGLRAFTGVASADDLDALDAMDGVSRDDLVRLANGWLDPDGFRVVITR
jgi:predicted Zn-dependent peptidase